LAQRDFDEALKRHPGAGDALIGRGLSRVYLGHYAAAVQDAEDAGKLTTPEMEINRACIFAQAMIRAEADKRQDQPGVLFRTQALQSLHRALDMVPAAQRAAFWKDKIATDPGLSPLRGLPAFRQLGLSLETKNARQS
jgi:hypothetical protein